MPRLIDRAQRDRDIADAAWRLLARDGLLQLSVRNVAAESGLATASLRRAFPTQDALRRYCVEVLRERATERILALTGSGFDLAMGIACELLPLDDNRRTEMAVQVQLGALALTDEQLRPAYRSLHVDVGRACTAAVGALQTAAALRDDIDVDEAARELHALLDGLALHLLWEHGAPQARWARELLESRLRSLTQSSVADGG